MIAAVDNLLPLPARWLFWISAAAIAFAYAIYPALILLLSRIFGREPQAEMIFDHSGLPSVCLIIAAYNEEAVIARRIENALATDYPPDKFSIVVASDGSSDATVEIVGRYADRGVRLLAYPARRGKSTVLNSAVEETSGQIIMLSDANTLTHPDAARCLVRWFSDPGVGVVCGKLVLTDATTGQNSDGLYWKYETFLKTCEGRLGALLGSNGAIYAIARKHFRPIPSSTIVDDFVIPLLARLQTDCRIIYDRQAIAREETAPDLAGEFRRRSRIGAGGFQAIGLLWPLLNPRHGWVAFTFFSHKILRWLCPFFMIFLIVANVLLLSDRRYKGLLAIQGAFYAAAIVGAHVRSQAVWGKLLRLCNMFVMMNAALLAGFFRWASGPQPGTWAPTQRLGELKASAQPP